MAARAIWKGSISFGLVNIPVALYSAENRGEELSFHMLDRRDMAPVGYKRVNKRTGRDVTWDEITKGYEYDPGRYVVVTDEDFIRANVDATRTVEIVDFVAGEEIDPAYFERPYYLAPANKAAHKGYALLREALKRTGKVGIATVVIRTKQYVGAVMAHGPVMLLNLMRYAYEVRDAGEVEVPAEDLQALGVSEKELDLAESLVEQMVTTWDPEKYRDTYRDDVLSLIRRKVERGETKEAPALPGGVEEEPAPAGVVDIMSLLKKSVAQRTSAGGTRKAAARGGRRAPHRKTA